MTDAENGAQNVRERSDAPVTALEQGNNADLKITDRFTRWSLTRENLSMDARNVKVDAVGGTVTLIGTVAKPRTRSAGVGEAGGEGCPG